MIEWLNDWMIKYLRWYCPRWKALCPYNCNTGMFPRTGRLPCRTSGIPSLWYDAGFLLYSQMLCCNNPDGTTFHLRNSLDKMLIAPFRKMRIVRWFLLFRSVTWLTWFTRLLPFWLSGPEFAPFFRFPLLAAVGLYRMPPWVIFRVVGRSEVQHHTPWYHCH